MKKLLFVIAGAAAFAAFAADPTAQTGDIDVLGFENFDLTDTANVTGAVVGRGDDGQTGTSKWAVNPATGEDSSYVTNVPNHAAGVTEPKLFADATAIDQNSNKQYLALDTEGSELQRVIGATIDSATYIDTLVQFTVTEDEEPTIDGTTKLAIWMGVGDGATNLYVKGGSYSVESTEDSDITVTVKSYKLSGRYEPGIWYRLTVKAINSIADSDWEGSNYPGFEIRIDGTPLTVVDDQVYTATALDWFEDGVITDTSFLTGGTFIPSAATALSTAAATITSVGFQGTGAIDDFVVTTNDPFPPSTIDFTLTWTASEVSAVSYVLSTAPAATNTLTSGTAVQLAPGDGTATIELIPTFTTGYEFDKVTMGETELGLTFAIPGVTTNATLFAKAATPAYPTYIDITDTTIKGKYDAWKNTYQADTQSAWETAFLLNMDPTESVAAGTALLKIASITEVSGGWELEIVSDATTLTAETNNDGLVGNGYLAITYAADLATLTSGGTTVNLPVTVTDGKIKVTVSAPGAKFMKATLTSTPAPQE